MSAQSGFVSEGVAGRLLFQRCDAGGLAKPLLALQDGTADRSMLAGIEQVRQVMLDADRPLYVEFVGEVAGAVLTARRFGRAIGHVANCAAAPAALAREVRLYAEGGLPAWRLRATSTGARLDEPGAKPVQFAALSLTDGDVGKKQRSYTTKSVPGGETMRLDVTEQACQDERSETAYGARVVAHYGKRRLEGCAARY
ncbi:MAG: hypothetical protein OEY03_09585 [Rhizobacter sp.]|nr:hypothetical protein [Rhizobacter sp.]